MAYHPDLHHRRSIRLRDYDYSATGAYFVTLCAWQRENLFGAITDGAMQPNEFGQLVAETWKTLPQRYPEIGVDAFVVMPNHIHGIIVIHTTVGAIHESPDCHESRGLNGSPGAIRELPLHQRRTMTLTKAIGYLKMNSAKQINLRRNAAGLPVWQRNYHEHVIRSDRDLAAIRDYINSNPLRWDEDEYRSHVP